MYASEKAYNKHSNRQELAASTLEDILECDIVIFS